MKLKWRQHQAKKLRSVYLKPSKQVKLKTNATDIIETEFKEFLGLNKINYAKAERLKSKKDGRVLPIFQLDINDPDEAEALISQNLACNVTGIVYKVEEFRAPISVLQCYNCKSFGHSAKSCRSKQKCLICGGNHSHKGCLSRESRKPTCANCQQPKNLRLCCKPKHPPAASKASDI